MRKMIPSGSYRCSFDKEEGEEVAFSPQDLSKYRHRKWQSSAASASSAPSSSLFYKTALYLYIIIIIIALGSLQIVVGQIPPISMGPASYLVPDCGGDRG